MSEGLEKLLARRIWFVPDVMIWGTSGGESDPRIAVRRRACRAVPHARWAEVSVAGGVSPRMAKGRCHLLPSWAAGSPLNRFPAQDFPATEFSHPVVPSGARMSNVRVRAARDARCVVRSEISVAYDRRGPPVVRDVSSGSFVTELDARAGAH